MRRDAPATVIAAEAEPAARRATLWSDAWDDLRRRPMFWCSVVLIVVITAVALFPGVFAQAAPNNDCLLADSNGGPAPGHPLGFTKQGCDVYSRIVHGTGTSLSVGVLSTAFMALLGIVFGALAGFYGGWIDAVLSRVGDIFFSIPYILAAVVIMSVFAKFANVWVISLAIGVFAWPASARVLRAEVLRVRTADHVLAATAIGLSRFRILLRHVLPNAIAPVIVVTTLSLAGAIVAEATLSFLGVGLPSDVMSWGNDISQAQGDIRTAPQTLVYPSVALSVTVLSFIMLGEAVRHALDPKARARR